MPQPPAASPQPTSSSRLVKSELENDRRMPLSLPEQCALPLAAVAQELAPIPHIGRVLKDLTILFGIIGRSRVNREQWKLLQGRCIMVARIAGAVVTAGGGLPYPRLQEAAAHLKRTISYIGQRADHWVKLNMFAELVQFTKISEEIKGHFYRLDTCLSSFSRKQDASREEWISYFTILQRRELAQLELFLKLLHEQMHIEFEPAKENPEIIVKFSNEIHAFLEQVVLQKFQIFQVGSNRTGPEYAEAERVLQVIRTVTDIHLPPSLLVGRQCVLESPLPIRTGVTCDVYQARFLTERVAKKVFRIGTSDEHELRRYAERFLRDTSLLVTLRSEYTLPTYGIGMDTSGYGSNSWELYTVSPLMKNYDAVTYLKKYRNNPDMNEEIMRIITDAAMGLRYLHSRSPPVIHSGMRGDNILVTDNGGGLLGGFGLTKVLSTGNAPPTVMTGRTDAYRWMAPEMLVSDMPALQTSCDIWGWAMAALELISGVVPFHKLKQPWMIMTNITKNRLPARSEHPEFERYAVRADEMWRLLERCWEMVPEHRPTIDEVVKELQRIQTFESPISRRMSCNEMVRCIVAHGCPDATSNIDFSRLSKFEAESGGFGLIYKGYLFDGTQVAVKCPRLALIGDEIDRSAIQSAIHEIYAASKLRHENIIQVIGVADLGHTIAMVLPWMSDGTVDEFILRNPTADRINLCKQVVNGLAYMHEHEIVHGDLKGRNILVSEPGKIKITDFGNTTLRQYTLRFTGGFNSQGFSTRWAAPELLGGEEIVFTFPADVFALGMTLLEIITGDLPFKEKNEILVIRAISSEERPQRPEVAIPTRNVHGDNLWNLLTSCWAHVPNARPPVANVRETIDHISQEELNKGPYIPVNYSSAESVVLSGNGSSSEPSIDNSANNLQTGAQTNQLASSISNATATQFEALRASLSQLDPIIFSDEIESIRRKLSVLGVPGV